MIFPLFYCYSSFSIATPSLFGNAHWILKTVPQTSSPTVNTIHLCFCDLFLFYCSFSFSIAMLSIFGNVHCTLKALPNIITNSDHHPLFFPVKFPHFIAIFHLQKHSFLYLEVHTGPENSAPCCHQQWAPLLSSPMHPTALPEWLQQVQKKWQVFCWN